VSEDQKFSPTLKGATVNCIKYFEAFESILQKCERIILVGSLQERQAVVILQSYLAQNVIDTITAYLKIDMIKMTYKQVLQTVQWYFIPLRLKTFERVVFAYQINESIEDFMQFGSKVFRHLKLCSRMQPVDKKEEYIEIHRVKILKRSLPTELFDLLERKESLYHSFSSTEILDHYVSFQHN
jgi:hypothetical protein